MESAAPFRCVSARRSLKFQAGLHARHFLAFDPAISKHERMVLFVELLAQAHRLADISGFEPPPYAPEQNVELRVLTDPRHPAFGQIGLFAKKTIPTNTVVTPYTGFIEIFGTSCSSRNYTMGFGCHGDDYALDAEFAGNYGRFANDPRGVEGLSANISAKCHFTSRGEAYTALVSRRVINKGEEILMSYGKAHSLRASPWMGLKGETLTWYRTGSTIPFSQLGKRARQLLDDSEDDRANNRWNGPHRPPAPYNGSPNESPDLPHEAEPNAPRDDAPLELLWECPQCGAWSLGSPAPVRIDHCMRCGAPRLHRARLVALCCRAPPDRAAMRRGIEAAARAEPHAPKGESAGRENGRGGGEENGRGVAHGGTAEQVDWPLNVPFMPWQVWDAAIPLSALARHARFETQENLFLYKVSLQQEDKPTRRQESQEQKQLLQRGRKPHVRRRKEELWPVDGGTLTTVSNTTQSETPQCSPNSQIGACEGGGGVGQFEGTTEYLFYVGDHLSVPFPATCQQVARQDHRFKNEHSNSSNGEEEEEEEECIRTARASLGYLLRNVSRRVFTDRAYRRGDAVAAVGGIIRMTGDPRRRPDDAVLEIPMRYFIPTALRSGSCADSLENKQNGELSDDSSGGDDDAAMFLDLCRRLDGLSLVVTNEMMYCPCLVPHGGVENDEPAINPRENCNGRSLLDLCNVCLVLTVDALGSPYVAAVAVRDIAPYEPLLAYVGCQHAGRNEEK